jgi:hypothetical protein
MNIPFIFYIFSASTSAYERRLISIVYGYLEHLSRCINNYSVFLLK